MSSGKEPLRVVILVGSKGRGSNMQAIINACRRGETHAVVSAVISPSADAPAIDAAASQGIPTYVCPYDSEALFETLDKLSAGLIALAGYMRRLDEKIVRAWPGRIMNIHPALIPSFCGRGMYGHHVHQAVLDAGVRFSGCTVHFVDENYDTGPIIDQAVVGVEQDDTPETLASRILEQEHRLYPRCIGLFADGRLKIEGRRVRILPERSPLEPSSAG